MISKDDIFVESENTIYNCIKEPLYTTGPNIVPEVQQITMPHGSVLLKFGNGVFGRIPTFHSEILVHYIQTSREDGNKIIEENTVDRRPRQQQEGRQGLDNGVDRGQVESGIRVIPIEYFLFWL